MHCGMSRMYCIMSRSYCSRAWTIRFLLLSLHNYDWKLKFESELSELQVMQEILDMDRNIELLRKAIRDKEAYMKVAQSRLEERTKRLNVEICKDHPMKG